MLGGKFIALYAYISKARRPKINILGFYLRKLGKVEQIESKVKAEEKDYNNQ